MLFVHIFDRFHSMYIIPMTVHVAKLEYRICHGDYIDTINKQNVSLILFFFYSTNVMFQCGKSGKLHDRVYYYGVLWLLSYF